MKTVYKNGVVYTGSLPFQEAFVVEDGRFVYAGNTADAIRIAGEEACQKDLAGRFVCSGFIDSHMHILSLGEALQSAQLAEHTMSLQEMLEALRKFTAEHVSEQGAWIIGRGWNHDYFTDVDRMPDRWDLDQISKTQPVCIVRACGHCLVVNSEALRVLGITEQTTCPEGGTIEQESGVLTGRIYDNAMPLVYQAAVPKVDKEGLKQRIRLATRMLNSYGVTSCHSDDYTEFPGLPWQTVKETYEEMEASGELTVRVYQQSNFPQLDALKEFVAAGNHTGTGDLQFKTGPLKLVADGSLGSRTAWMSHPYADDPSEQGLMLFAKEELNDLIGYANAHGLQVAIHAIGDGCLDQVLDAIEQALTVHPKEDHRHGIVHCQITRPDQLERIARLKLHVYAQSIFLDYDMNIVEQRVGKELASTSYSWKTLKEKGCVISNGSDCPVELPHVMAGIQCAVTRQDLHGGTKTYLKDQAFTVQEALDSYTIGGAHASFEETIKGQIAPGMLADFVVLGENPFEVDPKHLRDIPVLETYLGGTCVYDRKQAESGAVSHSYFLK